MLFNATGTTLKACAGNQESEQCQGNAPFRRESLLLEMKKKLHYSNIKMYSTTMLRAGHCSRYLAKVVQRSGFSYMSNKDVSRMW